MLRSLTARRKVFCFRPVDFCAQFRLHFYITEAAATTQIPYTAKYGTTGIAAQAALAPNNCERCSFKRNSVAIF
jgi:hypothetical protein